MNRIVVGLAIAVAVVGLSGLAVSQTKEPPAVTDSNLEAFAKQMPDCKEFRNACQVCVRLADGKLGCSNIGVACNPSGPWQCSVPSKSGEPVK
jgi:hypothetical protein